MKKKAKKLVLAKETVRELQALKKVGGAGDGTVSACYSHCNSACLYCLPDPMM